MINMSTYFFVAICIYIQMDCSRINCGALKSPNDSRDWSFEALDRGFTDNLPEEFSYIEYEPPIRDQGEDKSCAAHVGAAIKEIHCWCDGNLVTLSPEFIYHHRVNKGSNGMYGRNVFHVLRTIGTVPQEMITENLDSIDARTYNKLIRHAKNYRIGHYARIHTVGGLRRAVYEIGPCYLSLPLCRRRPEFWRSEPGEAINEGHATVVIGYTREGFILRNSWGRDWNNDGHIIFPYADWNCHIECWVAIIGELPRKKTSKCTIL